MSPDDLILISVDDHIAEPEDMFKHHVPAKYLDRAPEVRTDEFGVQQWWYGDIKGRNLGLNAVAGKSPEFFNIDASRYDEMRTWLLRRSRTSAGHECRRPTRGLELSKLYGILRASTQPGIRSQPERDNDQGL